MEVRPARIITTKSYDILEDDIDNDILEDDIIIDVSFEDHSGSIPTRNIHCAKHSPTNPTNPTKENKIKCMLMDTSSCEMLHSNVEDHCIDIVENMGRNEYVDKYEGGVFSSLENSDDEFFYEKYISPNSSFMENNRMMAKPKNNNSGNYSGNYSGGGHANDADIIYNENTAESEAHYPDKHMGGGGGGSIGLTSIVDNLMVGIIGKHKNKQNVKYYLNDSDNDSGSYGEEGNTTGKWHARYKKLFQGKTKEKASEVDRQPPNGEFGVSDYMNSDGSISSVSISPPNEFNMDSDKLENMGKHKGAGAYKKLTYTEIEKSLSRFYEKDNKYSNELNLLTTYVKGQKHLYMQSQYITQLKLYILTIFAMSLTSMATVITPFYSNRILISCMNGLATLIITVINYLKLESTSRMYLFIANQYDVLENTLEMANNKVIVLENEEDQNKLVMEKLREVEYKISEIKTVGKILVPDEIALLFPVIIYINIFNFIKKMEFHKKGMILQFRDVKNEIRYIFHKWKNGLSNGDKKQREKLRLEYLLSKKDTIKNELITYQNAYSELDEIFTREIKFANSYKYFIWCSCCWSTPPKYEYKNSVIGEYLKSFT